jgi:hypothetical protein
LKAEAALTVDINAKLQKRFTEREIQSLESRGLIDQLWRSISIDGEIS